MPHPKVHDDKLTDALQGVFCAHGFEGASLSRISAATGLQRASLYHRFPGGKDEMALHVLEVIHQRFGTHILAPLAESGDPVARVKRAAQRISDFYLKGKVSCLLESLSLGSPSPAIRAAIHASFADCTSALAAVARESGASTSIARRRAEEAMIRIQGALVMSRATGDARPFQRVIKALPTWITEGALDP